MRIRFTIYFAKPINILDSSKANIESRLESKLAAKIIQLLQDKNASKAELAQRLGHKTISGELNKQIKHLLTNQIIEMTLPDKQNSRLQKYKLTKKGLSMITENS